MDSLTIQTIHTYEACAAFAEQFYRDPEHCDPMLMGDKQLRANLQNAMDKPETHQVLGVYRADRLVGFFSFLIIQEEQYMEMLAGLSREKCVFQKILSWLETDFRGYTVDFVLNPQNHILRELLSERNAEFEAEQQKMVHHFPAQNLDTQGVELFSQQYAQQYFRIHNKNMYWTGEKVAQAPGRFRTFLAVKDGTVVGYMDVTCCFEENEPFDLYVLPEYRRQGYGRKLLVSAIQMNQPGSMMLLVEVDNSAAIRLYESAGFVKASGPNYLTAHWAVPLA